MTLQTLPRLTSANLELDTSPDRFGELRSSAAFLDEPQALRGRMDEDGYLFLPGYLDRDEVLAARREMTDRLAAGGFLDPDYPSIESVASQGTNMGFRPDLALNNEPLHQLLYTGRMIEFYETFLGGEVAHFDFTWIRAVSPGQSTRPHCDIIYMGRGSRTLYTSWTPLGDVPLETGGLIVLEGSHKHERLRAGYCSKDVDHFCLNRRDEGYTGMGGGGNIAPGGVLSPNPVRLRDKIGGRWLTTNYQMGDLLVFSTYLVHASLDNHSNQILFRGAFLGALRGRSHTASRGA
ncbi:MAG: phytanoyl-CoA dioxygenase family protein [Chloroflexi bacterium]|nr:phytanoyl-CoA dioxygenase family protein [Chloroflexota bacterium]